MERKRLGVGIDALIGSSTIHDDIVNIDIKLIKPNPYQPRNDFDEDEIRSLAVSLKEHGFLQPVLVRRVDKYFELISGERRVRAAHIAGVDKIPAIIKSVKDEVMLVYALVENLQRKDLNPMEKSYGFKQLVERFGYKHEQIAQGIGVDRTTVSNFIRLLELPEEIRDALSKGLISFGHAKALLLCRDSLSQINLFKRILKEGLNVRTVERIASNGGRIKRQRAQKSAELFEIEQKLVEFFGVRVNLNPKRRGIKITIDLPSNKHLDDLLKRLGITSF